MLLLHWIAIGAVCFTALGRSLGIFAAKLRQLRYRRRAAAYPSTWRDRCTQPEPFLLFATTLLLLATHEAPPAPVAHQLLVSGLGALVATAGISLMLWAVAAFPTVSPGHYVLPEQRIVTHGPYAFVRHPLYLAALLIWLGLVTVFRSPLALACLVVYVLPGYLIYARAEERMMLQHFGEAYRDYCERVPMLIPARRSGAADA